MNTPGIELSQINRRCLCLFERTVKSLIDKNCEPSPIQLNSKEAKDFLRLACVIGSTKHALIAFEHARIAFERGMAIECSDDLPPIIYASLGGSVDVMNLLLDRGASVHVPGDNGKKALHYACECGYIDIARILLDNGARVNDVDDSKMTALHKICLYRENSAGSDEMSFFDSYLPQIENVVNDIKKKCPGESIGENQSGMIPPLKDCVNLVKLLLDRGADIECAMKHGYRPLHCACAMKHVNIIEILLERGANINASSKNGTTSLHHACSMGDIDVVKTLLRHGADKNIKDSAGKTALEYCQTVEMKNLFTS